MIETLKEVHAALTVAAMAVPNTKTDEKLAALRFMLEDASKKIRVLCDQLIAIEPKPRR